MRYHYAEALTLDASWGKKLLIGFSALAVAAAGAFSLVRPSHALQTVSGCAFDDTSVVDTWILTGDCTATLPILVQAGITLDGAGHTIGANFTAGPGYENNTIILVANSDMVTIKNLNVDGSGGTNLHGVQFYTSNGGNVENVAVRNNDQTGLLVNGSEVDVMNLTTSGNGWNGVNVDQGTGVSNPAILRVAGVSHHSELAQIYVDDTTKNVQVVDVNNQYLVTDPITTPDAPRDRLYTLKPAVVTKDQCKNGGYMNVLDRNGNSFKNQGQCVSYTVANSNGLMNRR